MIEWNVEVESDKIKNGGRFEEQGKFAPFYTTFGGLSAKVSR